MLIIGLTGSIGMGKSTAAGQFKARGIAVFDADAEVHRLYQGEVVNPIDTAFPGTVRDGQVDRQLLTKALLERPDGFARLEAIVHPLIRAKEREFLVEQATKGGEIAVLEIPLLMETGIDEMVDAVVVVSAGEATQKQRVLARPGMTSNKLDVILARQLRDLEKCARADYVVDTSGSPQDCARAIDMVIEDVSRRQPEAFARYWSTG